MSMKDTANGGDKNDIKMLMDCGIIDGETWVEVVDMNGLFTDYYIGDQVCGCYCYEKKIDTYHWYKSNTIKVYYD